jgi:hypothetical protein
MEFFHIVHIVAYMEESQGSGMVLYGVANFRALYYYVRLLGEQV